MSIADTAAGLQDELTALRHDLHRHPEVGLHLPWTQARVLDELTGLPLSVVTGTDLSSVTAVLRGTGRARPAADAPAVLLRADMDGLPMPEETGLPWASEVAGAMHGCGHDMHTAMLVGAARTLSAHRDELDGDVVFMFQPGEEGPGGAPIMIDEGVLQASGRQVDAAYGLHVFSSMVPTGQFVSRRGPMLAAADGLRVTIHGAGGHGSAPHLAIDPVTVACHVVVALQTMVTRRFDAFDPVIVGVGHIHAGEAPNVIPDEAMFWASVRTWSRENRERFRTVCREVVEGTAAAFGARAEIELQDVYPVTVTDASETDFAAEVITDLFGDSAFRHMERPFSGSEDFSFVLDQVPGTFIGLGATPVGADPDSAPFNHSPRAQYDDSVLSAGTTVYAEVAARRLARLAADRAAHS